MIGLTTGQSAVASEPHDILIVDDEPQICGLIRDSLADQGFTCISTTEPRLAKQLLDSHLFSLMIADIFMPDISGLDLLAHVRRNKPGCRVILMTGAGGTETLASALSLGAYDYMQKPLNMDELVGSIARAVGDDSPAEYLSLKAARALNGSSQLQEAPLESVQALVHAVEAKDPYTKRHSEHVAHYATHLAQSVGVGDAQMAPIRVAALLHDIGKIGTPDHILTKPGRLTEEEFTQIRRHPVLGAEILEHITVFASEAMFVRQHHENWDGSGYPNGLTGQDILFGSRILNVADATDAMLMQRTYKHPYPLEKVLDELRHCAGTQFDPDLAQAMAGWCANHRDKIILPQQAA